MKCFGWIQRLKKKNATILLVSHDTNTITTFCDRVLILEGGRVFAEGEAKPITVIYHNLLFGKMKAGPGRESEDEQYRQIGGEASQAAIGQANGSEQPAPEIAMPKAVRYGSGEARLLDWGLFDEQGQRTSLLNSGSNCRFSMRLRCGRDIEALSCGFAIKDRKGTVVWGVTNLTSQGVAWQARVGDVLTISCDCRMWLAAGDFFVTLGAAHLHDGTKIDFVEDAIQFRVVGAEGTFTTSVVNLESSLVIVPEHASESGNSLNEAVREC
jgi:hypothetical protein